MVANVVLPKVAHRFRVTFEDFGRGNVEHLTTQVMRVTRPGIVFYEVFGTPEVEATMIEVDLRDDVTDLTRMEVIMQVIKQIKHGDKFAMMIETLGMAGQTVEQWRLMECQIVDCRLSELDLAKADGLVIRLVVKASHISVSIDGEWVEFLGSESTRD